MENSLTLQMSRLVQYNSKTDVSVGKNEVLRALELLLNYFDQHVLVKRKRGACPLGEGFPKEHQILRCIHIIQHHLKSIIVRHPRNVDRVLRVLREVTLPICLLGTDIVPVNHNHSICCNGRIEDKDDNKICCDEEMIDTSLHFCCNDTKYERNKHEECCGRFRYDTQKYACCTDTLIDLQNQTCCNESLELSPSGKCCSPSYSTGTCIVCEDNKAVRKSINYTTHLCCGGTVKLRKRICSIKHSTEDEARDISVKDRSRIIANDDYASVMIESIVGAGSGILTVIGSACITYCCCQRCNIRYRRMSGKRDAKSDSRIVIFERLQENNMIKTKRSQNSFQPQLDFSQMQDDENAVSQDNDLPLLDNSRSEIPSELTTVICNNDSTDIFRPPFVNRELLKDIVINSSFRKGNLTGDHFKDSQTQTFTKNDKYKRNIFGEPFHHEFVFDAANKILQMEDSEAQLTLPESMTKNGSTEVFASTFRDIQAMTDKLDLLDNQSIASPAVEYCLASDQKLDGFACVRLPFVGKAEYLTVIKFESDEGLNAHTRTVTVPRKEKQNEDLDLFFVVEGKTVLICTKTFSGFVCITCKCNRGLELVAFLFGSYKKVNEKYEVYIRVYVADILFAIKDYKEKIFDDEIEGKRRKCLERDFQLELPDCDLDGNDYIEACFTPKVTAWQHDVHPRTGKLTFDEKQIIKLSSIAKNCQRCPGIHTYERSVTYKNWYLHKVQNVIPDPEFQCYINLDVCKKETDICIQNSIIIGGLSLREADRVIKEDSKPVQETSPVTETYRSLNRFATVSDTRRDQTLVRGESEPNLRLNTSSTFDSRSVMPSPELSQINTTMPYQALPYRSSSTAGEPKSGT